MTTTHQAYCGSLLAGERKSDRPYTHAIVMSDLNPQVYISRVRSNFYTRDVASTTKYFRRHLATPVGQCYPGRSWPVTADDHRQAAEWLGDLTDEQIVERELAKRIAEAEEYVAKHQGVPQVMSWHMGPANGAKALAAARAKAYHSHWRLTLVETVVKASKARPKATAQVVG